MIGRIALYGNSDKKNVGVGVRNKLIIEDGCEVRGQKDNNRRENRVVLGEIGEGSLGVPLSKDSMFEGFVDVGGIRSVIDNKNVVEELVNKSHVELDKKEEVLSEDVEDDNGGGRRKGVGASLFSLKELGKGLNCKLIVVWLGGMVLRKVMVASLKQPPKSYDKPFLELSRTGLTLRFIGVYGAPVYEEKEKGKQKEKRNVDSFWNFVQDCELNNIPFQGQKFTWFGTYKEEVIKERLDRALVNLD
ncbi:hypothetical protein PTKIN_Ptkin16aG0070600 [Pterospermum kingtungense]